MGNTCGWDRATRPCTASWSTCRFCSAFPIASAPPRETSAGRAGRPVEDVFGLVARGSRTIWRGPPSPTGVSLLPLVRGKPNRPATGSSLPARRERAIRTPAWYLRKAEPPELYVKPDDFWEVNDVAVRCQEIVECLLDAADRFEQSIYSGSVAELPPLGDVLIDGLG